MNTAHPVFVVGAPRTGTTLVKEVLNRHPRIHLFDEVHFFERIWDDRHRIGDLRTAESRARAFSTVRQIVRRFGKDQSTAEVLTDGEYQRRLEIAGGGYRGLLSTLLRTGAEIEGAQIWGDSSPQDVLYLPLILRWYPNARIVCLLRDPRGFLASYKNYWRRRESSYRERYHPITNSILWQTYMQALLEALRGPTAEAVHVTSYEELVDNPHVEVRRLCQHVGVRYESTLVDVETTNTSFTSATSEGIVSTSRNRWRTELTATEVWLGERVFGRLMQQFGYEPVSSGRLPPSLLECFRMIALLPGRFFNMLFFSHKPLRLGKVRRVIAQFRSN